MKGSAIGLQITIALIGLLFATKGELLWGTILILFAGITAAYIYKEFASRQEQPE